MLVQEDLGQRRNQFQFVAQSFHALVEQLLDLGQVQALVLEVLGRLLHHVRGLFEVIEAFWKGNRGEGRVSKGQRSGGGSFYLLTGTVVVLELIVFVVRVLHIVRIVRHGGHSAEMGRSSFHGASQKRFYHSSCAA